jgi:hypothetical protein
MAVENDDQLVERLVPKILASIRSKAKAVESIDIKADLTGITSIPCYDTSGGIFKQVLVDVNALKEPAFSAGETATDAANRAYDAASEANEAADSANEAAEAASIYANRVRDVTEEEWLAIEENEAWEEGVEYNVYSNEV